MSRDILNHDEFKKGKGFYEHDIDLYENTIEALAEVLNDTISADCLDGTCRCKPHVSTLFDLLAEGWIDDG